MFQIITRWGEQGICLWHSQNRCRILSSVLNSTTAIKVNIQIIRVLQNKSDAYRYNT
jgi:hypothetical protein